RMTGEFAETVNLQSGGGFICLADKVYDPLVRELLGMREEQFGQLVTLEHTAPLGEEAANAMGIPPGIPVVPAHSDGACSQAGSGCGGPREMTLSVGTSGAIRMVSDVPVLPENRETWCYCGVRGYLAGAAVAGACNCVDWFRHVLLAGAPSYESLEAGGVPYGGNPPVFLPFLFGERCPGWRDERRAGFLDVEGHHTHRDLYLALQMGVLFSLLQCYEPLAKLMGTPAKTVVSGGILLSPRWTRMAADILGLPLLPMRNKDASLIGAALLALEAAGMRRDGARPDLDVGALILPDAGHTAWYREQYARYLRRYAQT
ncbi:MAG TPA: FGGY-family carbohydrate kinase, partial [Candidatus Limnocylindria bacterium]|nr:FGGY-family carbohydrate kinase [Candidatus Limnocylindria bacterium]